MSAKSGWFGKSWGAPVCTPEDHRQTPEGEVCIYCGEPIEAHENGFIDMVGQPSHYACNLRGIFGGLYHIIGQCSCCGGDKDSDPPGFSRRACAEIAVIAWEAKQTFSETAFQLWLTGFLAMLDTVGTHKKT